MKPLSAWRLVNQTLSFVRAPVRAVSTTALPFERNLQHFAYRTVLRSIVLAAATILVLHVGASSAAPTFTVTSPLDIVADPANLTNGVCETGPGNGFCTLRAAVMKANHFPGGGVTINIPAGTYVLTIAPATPNDETTGAFKVSQATTFVGASMDSTFVEASVSTDHLFVVSGVTVSMSNMTIRNANAGTTGVGAGIRNAAGNLTLNSIHLTNNQAGFGGGLASALGTAVINNSLIDHNTANSLGGGIYNESGTLTLNNSRVMDNTTGASGAGGGIGNNRSNFFAPPAVATLNDTAVSGNRAGDGGGINNGRAGDVSSLTLNRSLINANIASGNGGGIFVGTNSLMTINNSTLSAQGLGGGIMNVGTSSLYHVTIAGNVGDSDNNSVGAGGIQNNGTLSLYNSLLAENYTANLAFQCQGTPLISQDYNYSQSTCTFGGTTTHNVPAGGDPLLGPLQNNGGATQTRALYAGSIVADQIPPAFCRDSLIAPTTDQRGVQRPIGALCDIGAFEGTVPLPLFNKNLIRNGDAEDGGGSLTGAFVGSPHWTVTSGTFTVVPYGAPGGFPTVGTDIIPSNHGYNFFAGGLASSSQATQMITVTAGSGVIDTGSVKYFLSGDFGGYFTDPDSAQLRITFQDSNHNPIGNSINIGNFDAVYRNFKTGLFSDQANGSVPAGTRYVQVYLIMTRINGAYNDAYADNLSLVLTGQTLDIDGNHSYDALTDGLLIIRYLFGLTGTSLTNGAIGTTPARSTPTDIVQYLDSIKPALDVDENGHADALTDGLLLIRYLFGLRGSSLITGAVGSGAMRFTAPDIETYIRSLMP